MEKYTIYCTPEQTKRAFDLGAPLEEVRIDDVHTKSIAIAKNGKFGLYFIPTAEQMVGWLEHNPFFKYLKIHLDPFRDYYWVRLKTDRLKEGKTLYHEMEVEDYDIRRGFYRHKKSILEFHDKAQAIRAGIDAALEYLEKKGE